MRGLIYYRGAPKPHHLRLLAAADNHPRKKSEDEQYHAPGHNITTLLVKHPEFAIFNQYLTLTHLADEINRRTTITVCAFDNAAMNSLLFNWPSINTVKNILSLHVLLDYFGPKKLHQLTNGTALAATLFQAIGSAPGSSGYVNITDIKGGRVALGPEDNGGSLDAFFVKGVEELPYNINVIQISKILPSNVTAAPSPAPAAMNLTGIMSAHGFKVFADTLIASPDASKTFQESMDGGLTVFCPMDDPFKAFLLRFKKGVMLTRQHQPTGRRLIRRIRRLQMTMRARGKKVRFDPERIVMGGGATGANELITFYLVNAGDAFRVQSPYYPAYVQKLLSFILAPPAAGDRGIGS